MAMGTRKRHAKQASMWVATQDLPRSVAHPFYTRLNQILDEHDFDGYVEGRCARFYADEGRPGLPPGRFFRLLLVGYFYRHRDENPEGEYQMGYLPWPVTALLYPLSDPALA